MGRRSNFPRVAKDFYITPARAVLPLVPHLPKRPAYAEPCAGDGALIDALAPYAELVWASDIEPRTPLAHENDALQVGLGDAEMFITNPPWTRAILHPLIVHLSDLAPTWLLFDSAWAGTGQARPFMERCRRIVAAGRYKWVPGSKYLSKDDASWYLFDRPLAGSAPLFFGRGCVPAEAVKRPRRICYDCGILIDRFGKWHLQRRAGILTTVHVDCAHPSGSPACEPLPLIDYIEARVA